MPKKPVLRKIIQAGGLGIKPKTFYQVQKGSNLRNFDKKTTAMKYYRKLAKK